MIINTIAFFCTHKGGAFEKINWLFEWLRRLQRFIFLMASPWDINRTHRLLTVILKICYWEARRSDDRINLFCQKKLLMLIILRAHSPNNFPLKGKLTKLSNIFVSLDFGHKTILSPQVACLCPIQCPSYPLFSPLLWMKCWNK